MKRSHLSLGILIAVVLVSCQEREQAAENESSTPNLAKENREQFAEAGRAAVGTLAEDLGSRLKAAIQEGGPVSAVRVCQQVAQPMTASVGHEREGITIARTALRYRNPKNAPDEIDQTILKNWQDLKNNGKTLPDFELVPTDEGKVRFYKPIMLKPICLNCHGPEEQLLPQLKTVLDELYPQDQARNFQIDDLRGAFRVEMEPSIVDP